MADEKTCRVKIKRRLKHQGGYDVAEDIRR